MRYGVLFNLIGAGLVIAAFKTRGAGYLLLWPGLCFAIIGVAYASDDAHVFGKRADGRLSHVRVVLLLPYLLLAWGLWHFRKLVSREPGADEIMPGLWLGRRASIRELPTEVEIVFDLTAEFPACARIAKDKRYVCLPVLDARTPDDEAFRAIVKEIAACDSPVLVHCAVGHGRSAAVVAAVLIRKGLAADCDTAIRMIREIRPGIGINRRQRKQIERCTAARDSADARR